MIEMEEGVIMGEIENIRGDLNDLKTEHYILKENYNFTNNYMKETLQSLSKNLDSINSVIAEIRQENINTQQFIALEKQRLEFEMQKHKQESDTIKKEVENIKCINDKQDERLQNLTLRDHFSLLWTNPMGKLLSGVVALLLAYFATKFGVDTSVLK